MKAGVHCENVTWSMGMPLKRGCLSSLVRSTECAMLHPWAQRFRFQELKTFALFGIGLCWKRANSRAGICMASASDSVVTILDLH
jgi:hypothetical protein